jgi:hypothetical protein
MRFHPRISLRSCGLLAFGLPIIAFMIFADVRRNDVEFEPKISSGIFESMHLNWSDAGWRGQE